MALGAMSKIILKILRKRGVKDGTAFAKKLGFDDALINKAVKHKQKWEGTFLPLAPAKSTAKTLGESQLPGKIGKRRAAKIARDKAIYKKSGGRDFAGSGLWSLERKRAARIKKQKPGVRKRMEQRISDDRWRRHLKEGTVDKRTVPNDVMDRLMAKEAPKIAARHKANVEKYSIEGKGRALDKKMDDYYYPKPATRKTLEVKSELATTKALPTLSALRGSKKAMTNPLGHLADKHNALEREVMERMRGYTPGSVPQSAGVVAEKNKVMQLLSNLGLIKRKK